MLKEDTGIPPGLGDFWGDTFSKVAVQFPFRIAFHISKNNDLYISPKINNLNKNMHAKNFLLDILNMRKEVSKY